LKNRKKALHNAVLMEKKIKNKLSSISGFEKPEEVPFLTLHCLEDINAFLEPENDGSVLQIHDIEISDGELGQTL
jgi:hypothetical protein